jgi:Cu+-exporting ATPase
LSWASSFGCRMTLVNKTRLSMSYPLCILLVLALGCTARMDPAPISPAHPASDQAVEAEPPARSEALSPHPLNPSNTEPGAKADLHAGHGAQAAHEKSAESRSRGHATRPGDTQSGYVCPMHPAVRSATAGRCPQCGMELTPVEGE